MAGEFTSWTDLYTRAKDALAMGDIERFMTKSVENSREMRVTMGSSLDTQRFLDFLANKATEELLGVHEGYLYTAVMGGDD